MSAYHTRNLTTHIFFCIVMLSIIRGFFETHHKDIWMRVTKLMLLFLVGTIASYCLGHDFSKNNISIDHPWSKPTPPISKYGVAYFNIKNSGTSADNLLKVQIPKDIADSASLHDVVHDGDIVRMRELIDGKTIPANSVVEFKPGGSHVMLEGLKKPIKLGDKFTIELIFKKAGSIPVEIWVEDKKAPKKVLHAH